jgi:hypothetical protein
MRRRAWIVTALLLVLFPLSCTGEDRLSKQEFISRADAICNDFDDQLADMRPPTTTGGIRDFAETTQQLMSDALTQLRELKPPEDDAETVDEMLSNLERVTSLLPDLAAAAEDRDLDKIQELNGEFSSEINAFNESAESYGLKVCGSTSPGG